MITKFDLNALLEPFETPLSHDLCLPHGITHETFEKFLKTYFNDESLKLKVFEASSVSHLPHQLFAFSIIADPLKSPLYMTMTPPSQSKVFEIFMGSKDPFTDQRLKNGAAGFLLANAINYFNEMQIFSNLSFYLSESIQTHASFHHLKTEIMINGSLPLIFDFYFPDKFIEEFNHLFKGHLSNKKLDLALSMQLLTGGVKLKSEEFRSLKLGDLVFLDENFYQPDTKKGLGFLVLNNKQIAQVRITEHNLKLLDFNPLSSETFMESSTEALKHLGDVELDLSVEFAKLKIKMKDLEHLALGQTLDIHKDNPIEIYLTLHGQRLAKGELVKLGDKMAFLIQELHNG